METRIVKQSNQTTLPDIKKIEEFADSVKNSAFAKAFERKNKDGKVTVETADIVAAVALGYDMGISPSASLLLGKKLNANSYFSVLRGKELGLDPITSMSKIYVIPTQNGDVIALDVGIITKAILDSGTEIHILHDCEPVPLYIDPLTNTYLGHKYLLFNENGTIKDNYFLFIKDITKAEEVKKARIDNKVIIMQHGMTRLTSIRLVRKSNNIDLTFHYTLQDATDAGLYNGFHSTLIDAKTKKKLYMSGRDNWNKHPCTMLRNRPLSIGGRVVVADKLQQAYSMEEAMEIVNAKDINELETISIDNKQE